MNGPDVYMHKALTQASVCDLQILVGPPARLRGDIVRPVVGHRAVLLVGAVLPYGFQHAGCVAVPVVHRAWEIGTDSASHWSCKQSEGTHPVTQREHRLGHSIHNISKHLWGLGLISSHSS